MVERSMATWAAVGESQRIREICRIAAVGGDVVLPSHKMVYKDTEHFETQIPPHIGHMFKVQSSRIQEQE